MTYSDLFDNPTQETLFTVRYSSFEDGEVIEYYDTVGEAADEGLSGDVYFDQPAASGLPVKFWWTISYLQGAARVVWGAGAAEYTTAETVNGIQVLMSAGNTSSVSVQLYGLKK